MSLAKKSWKKAIALFLAVVMALSFVPNITARAAVDGNLYVSEPVAGLDFTYGVGYTGIEIGTMTKTDWVVERDGQPKFAIYTFDGTNYGTSDIYATAKIAVNATVTGATSTPVTVNIASDAKAGKYFIAPYFGANATAIGEAMDSTNSHEIAGITIEIKKASATIADITQTRTNVFLGTEDFSSDFVVVNDQALSVVDASGTPIDLTAQNVVFTPTAKKDDGDWDYATNNDEVNYAISSNKLTVAVDGATPVATYEVKVGAISDNYTITDKIVTFAVAKTPATIGDVITEATPVVNGTGGKVVDKFPLVITEDADGVSEIISDYKFTAGQITIKNSANSAVTKGTGDAQIKVTVAEDDLEFVKDASDHYVDGTGAVFSKELIVGGKKLNLDGTEMANQEADALLAKCTATNVLTMEVGKDVPADTYTVTVAAPTTPATLADAYTITGTSFNFTVNKKADVAATSLKDAKTKVKLTNSVANAETAIVGAPVSYVGTDAASTDNNAITGATADSHKVAGIYAYQYGKYIKPGVTVTYVDGSTKTLVEGQDYELIGTGVTANAAGQHSIQIKGIGNYKDSIYVDYKMAGGTRGAMTWDLTTLGNTNEDKDTITSNFIYNGSTAVTAKAKVNEDDGDNPTITYEYYKADSLVDDKGTLAENDDVKYVWHGAGQAVAFNDGGALTAAQILAKFVGDADARAAKKLNKTPVDAGKYVVFAVVAEGGNFSEAVAGIEFEIDPLAVQIVPNKDQGKTYGDGAEKIGFKAYTYYNVSREEKWSDYTNLALDGTLNETAGTMKVKINGVEKEVKLNDVRPDEDYSGISETGAPYLTREGYKTVEGEHAGKYAIILNDEDGVDTNHVGTLVQSATLGNQFFTIAQRELSEAYAKFILDGKEVNVLSYDNSTITRTPEFVVKDNITVWDTKTKAFVAKNDIVLVKNEDYTASKDLSADKGGNYTIVLTAKDGGNYVNTKELNWSIAQSTTTAYEKVYADGLTDADHTFDVNEADTYEVTYDGAAHYIEPDLYAIKEKDKATEEAYYGANKFQERTNDVMTVYYKNMTPTFYDIAYTNNNYSTGTITKLVKVEPSKDWDTTVPKFTKAGTYTVNYMIKSQDGLYADVIGSFTIVIKQKTVNAKAPSLGVKTYQDTDAVSDAIENEIPTDANGKIRITKKTDDQGADIRVRDNKEIQLKYTWPDGALETAGPYTLSVGPREFDKDALTATWIAAYDFGVKKAAWKAAKGYTSPADDDAIAAFTLKDWDKLTDAEKEATKTYDKLKDNEKKAAEETVVTTYVGATTLAGALELDEARCELSKNFIIEPTAGTLTVQMGSLDFDVEVGLSDLAKADAVNKDADPANDYNWKYGTYDATKSLVALKDADDEALADVFTSTATYNVLIGETGSSFKLGFTNITAAALDNTLRGLTPGTYRLQALIGVVDGKTSGGSAISNVFVVKKGTLEIVDTEEELVGGKTSAGKAPARIEKITVKEVDSTEGLSANKDTYKLVYKVKGTNLDPEWVDSLTDLKKDADTSAWAETALGANAIKVLVAVVPLADGLELDANYDTKNGKVAPVEVKIEVTPTEASENDKVANLTITYLAEDAGKQAIAGKQIGATANNKLISKTYGTYTANDTYANGNTKVDADQNYYPVTKDNEIVDMTLAGYVANELLTNNGFAVGAQNTFGRYENGKFAPYMDASMFAYDLIPTSGANGVLDSLAEEPRETYSYGTTIAGKGQVAYVNGIAASGAPVGGSQTSDVGIYRALNANHLVAGMSFEAELISDPNGIIATRKTVEGTEPILSASGTDIKYTLAKELPTSGTANIKVTVHRTYFSDIEFYINLVVDGAGPELGVFNVDLSKDTQTEINKKAKVTDNYVNKALEFTVTANDVKEDGLYYTFAKAPMEIGNATTAGTLEYSFAQAVKDKFDSSKGWFAVENGTVTSPAEEDGYILYVRGEDEAGNVAYASSATGFTIDTVKPVVRNASDSKVEYGEEAKTCLVEVGGVASLTILDQSDITVSYAIGDGEFAPLTANKSTGNYDLEANAETYTIKAIDKALNETVAKIDVNLANGNKGNNINVVFEGKTFDLKTVVDKTDATKKLYVKSDNSGDITFANGTDLTEEDGKKYVYDVDGTRGEGTVTEDGILTVTKAGTFAIEVIGAKNGIYGKTIVQANITVEKGTREVGISLVEDKTAETAVAKTEFTRTEAAKVIDFAKLSFSVEGVQPKDEYVKFIYFNKETGAQLDEAPVTAGEYEVAVRIEDDGLYNAAASENATLATLNKRAAYKVVDTHKVVVNNDATKGTLKVVSGTTEMTAEQLLKVADRTPLTISATALEGYTFAGWTDVKGIELTAADALKDTVTIAAVTGDVSLTATYTAKIAITKQPVDVKAYADEEAKFEVVATGNGEDDLTYQWQVKGKDDNAFRNIEGATSATYTIAKVARTDDGNTYRVVITSKSTNEVKNSDEVKLDVIGNSIEGAVIVLEADSAEYTGKAIVPVIKSVTVGTTPLAASRDYDIEVTNFINAGEYTFKITGKGDWTGAETAKFTITPKAITKDMFSIEDVQYTGKAIEAPVVAKDGETELVAGTDYEVAYKNNTEVGTATATITGKGNYTGSVDVKFAILGESIAKATVTGISTAAYTGKAITPTPVVKLDGKTLKKGTDYTVSYKNNTKVGTATVTITGKGDYSGKITKKFLIKQISFKYRAYVQKKNWMSWSTA
ncbi:MAG: hypothetical protein IKO61_06170, partial [Lachnospiraceae bacterium]|nr:hypothetical protein [Lachnospiraceae bacterium]